MTSNEIDMQGFAKRLADALGFTYVAPEGYTVWGTIDAGDGITLSLYSKSYSKNAHMVEVSVHFKEDRHLEHHERARVSSINVNSTRPVEAIAKDIERRMMDPARHAAEQSREAYAKRQAKASALTERIAMLEKRYPSIRIRRDGGDNSLHAGAVLYGRASGGGSIDFRLSEGGHFYIDRVSLNGWDEMLKLMDMVAGK